MIPSCEIPTVWLVDNETYHANTSHLSHSMLEVFAASMVRYEAVYVDGTIPRPAPSPAMQFGTAFHTRVLEPERFEASVAIAPLVDKRTKAGKEEFAAFQAEAAGRLVISWDDAILIESMATAIYDHDIAKHYLGLDGKNEHTYTWVDRATDIPCKARTDRFIPQSDAETLIIDIKTTDDPTPDNWHRKALQYGYHRQSTFYCRGALMANQCAAPPRFLFIVVGKEPPHEVWVYEFDHDTYHVASRDIDTLLAEMKVCLDTQCWTIRNESQVQMLRMEWQGWARKERLSPLGWHKERATRIARTERALGADL